eukprot:SAG11_NODE_159_length_14027_cov_6.893667_8_plen_133_part_00
MAVHQGVCAARAHLCAYEADPSMLMFIKELPHERRDVLKKPAPMPAPALGSGAHNGAASRRGGTAQRLAELGRAVVSSREDDDDGGEGPSPPPQRWATSLELAAAMVLEVQEICAGIVEAEELVAALNVKQT